MSEVVPKEVKKIGSLFVKGIVIFFVVIYVLSPIDLMPGPIDDIIIAIMGLSFAGIDLGKVFGTAKSSREKYQSSKRSE